MSTNDAIATFIADTVVAHEIVHGDASTTVETDNGSVRSLAKLIADKQDAINEATVMAQAGPLGLEGRFLPGSRLARSF